MPASLFVGFPSLTPFQALVQYSRKHLPHLVRRGRICLEWGKIKVLIAEGDKTQAMLMEDWLGQVRDIDLCPVANEGRSGLESICRCRPDVVIWDMFLPGMDALELLEELSVQPPRPWPRIIVTAWSHTPQLANTLLACGAGYLIDRPVKLSVLEARIRMLAAPPDETPVEACLRLYDLASGPERRYRICRSCIDYYLSATEKGEIQLKQVEVDVSRQMKCTPDAVQKGLHRAIVDIYEAGRPAFRRIWSQKRAPSNLEFLRLVANDLRTRF